MKSLFHSLLMAALIAATASQAHAAFVFTLSQVGSNVIVTGNGTLNLTALSPGVTTAGYNPEIASNAGVLLAGPLGSTETAYFSGISGPASFGAGNQTFAGSGTGTFVGIESSSFLIVPSGYISGSPLSDTTTFTNATFSSLGFTPGTYTYTWGAGATADSLTVTTVPEPSTWALCGLGTGVLAVLLRRRRGQSHW